MISGINQNYSPSFQAVKIAETKNAVNGMLTQLDIYQVSHSDRCFLTELCKKIDMRTLMPGFEKDGYKRWHEMLEIAVDKALKTDRISYIAAKDGKPCGIITFKPGKNKFELDCICTWPVEFGKKVNLAGQTLFNMMFETFSKTKAEKIRLDAITDGPYKTEPKYKRLGFRPVGFRDGNKVEMETTSHIIKNVLKDLQTRIYKTDTQTPAHLNLFTELEI